MRLIHGWIMTMLAMILGFNLAGCTSPPSADTPIRSTVQAVVGNPAETDTECTLGRWAGSGMCDYVIVAPSGASTNILSAGRMWSGGWDVGTSPTVYETGTSPTTTRIWVKDIWDKWDAACASVSTGLCQVTMYYLDNNSSIEFYLDVRSDVWDMDRPLVNAYYLVGSSWTLATTYTVAYDTTTGSYGITEAAHRRIRWTSLALGLVDHDFPSGAAASPQHILFSSDHPSWNGN